MRARIAGGLTQIVLCAERMCEPVEIRHAAAPEMNAQMMKGALDAALAHGEAVEVQFQSRTPQDVRMRHAGETLDLEIELHGKSRGVDEGAQTAAGGVVLRECGSHVGVPHTRIDAYGWAIRRAADAQRQEMPVVGADPQPQRDAAPAQRLVGAVEVQVAMHGATRVTRGHPARESRRRERDELLRGTKLEAKRTAVQIAA